MALDYRVKPDNDLKDTFEDIPYFFAIAIVIFFSVIIYLLPVIVVLDTAMLS